MKKPGFVGRYTKYKSVEKTQAGFFDRSASGWKQSVKLPDPLILDTKMGSCPTCSDRKACLFLYLYLYEAKPDWAQTREVAHVRPYCTQCFPSKDAIEQTISKVHGYHRYVIVDINEHRKMKVISEVLDS